MCCNKVIRIFEQLLLGERINQSRDSVCSDESQYKTTDAFNQRMSPFQQDTDFENPVDTGFVHVATPATVTRRVLFRPAISSTGPRLSMPENASRRCGSK